MAPMAGYTMELQRAVKGQCKAKHRRAMACTTIQVNSVNAYDPKVCLKGN